MNVITLIDCDFRFSGGNHFPSCNSTRGFFDKGAVAVRNNAYLY